MMLADICEPVFQYVCELNRKSRRGVRVDFGNVRGDVKSLLGDARRKAEKTSGMMKPWPTAEMVLTFFIDSMIMNSKLASTTPGQSWRPMSYDLQKLGYDEEFWNILDETLKDMSDDATQVLSVFYVCVGLGFQGFNIGRPQVIHNKMREMSARLLMMVDADQESRICDDAYVPLDTRNLTVPPGKRVTGMMLLSLLLLVVVLVSCFFFFKEAGDGLKTSLDGIQKWWADQNKPTP